MKIKLSQLTPRRKEENIITPKVRALILKGIHIDLDVIHVMKKDILIKIVLRERTTLTRRRETKEDIMLMLQRMMNLHQREPEYESEDSSTEDEYVLISALTGNITHGSDDWLIDSGASKHMTGFKESFVKLSEHESPHKVKLGHKSNKR